ncbi:MAG: hypothetical protein IKD76_01585 [Clostridia bacterium]|nr:hypothetical protein [Clostridia bacterium]
MQKYKVLVAKIEGKVQDITSKNLLGYEKFVEASYVYDHTILYKLASNTDAKARVEIADGNYTTIVPKRDVKEFADAILNFNKFLTELDIDLLYVQAPYKISETQEISSIYKDYSNANMDDFLSLITGKVDYIDIRELIKKNNLNHLDLFYKTDHHWLPETGLWATQEVSKYINDNYEYGLQEENIDTDNFKTNVYERYFLGSHGRFVSLSNAEPENLNIILPKYDTKLSVKIPDKGIDKTDTFENTLIDWSKIEEGKYYNTSQYAAYAYGDRPLIEIHNELVCNGKKILVLKDSFAEVFTPFLALENEYVSVIDLRYFDGSLKTYIKNYNPDMVIVIYNGNSLKNSKDEDDSAGLWNFE